MTPAEPSAVLAEAEAATQPRLRLDGINAYYGAFHALRDLSLQVGGQEIVCLLGGNASGKSTTMKVILGLLRPRSGQVLLDGAEITALPTAEIIKRGIASVPEGRRVFPGMSVLENLRMGAYLRRDNEVRADLEQTLDMFPRLRERLSQAAGTLSGGEQQMLALARALMNRPRLICMDEPTMGLAPIFVERVLELVAEINRRGVAIFMVEQNATLALSIAHRGYVLQNGALRLDGSARELLDNPAVQEAYLGGRASA